MKAKFVHDCDKCTFLTIVDGMDVYVCTGDTMMGTDIIARYGDDGPDYKSVCAYIMAMLVADRTTFLDADPHLLAGFAMAKFQGLLPNQLD